MAPPRHLFSVRPEPEASAAASDNLDQDAWKPYWMEKPPVTPAWVILGKMARVSAVDPPSDLKLSAGSGLLRLVLAAPPQVTLVDVPPVIFPATPTMESSPTVLAADGGLLLLQADQGPSKGNMTLIDLPGREEFVRQEFVRDLFILDGWNGRVRNLPNPHYVQDPACLGLLGSEYVRRHDFVIAELQYRQGTMATLMCFSTNVGEWVEKRIAYPLPHRLIPDVVISHSKSLWWIDLSWCLLTCDPLADVPVLRMVPLPPGKQLDSRKSLDKHRWVGVSCERLRFVEIHKNSFGADHITIWTMHDDKWTKDHETAFDDIWDDVSYHLPRTVPVLALLDPIKPTVVFLLQAETLYSVDLVTRKVLGYEVLHLPAPHSVKQVGSNFFCNWKLGSTLCLENEEYITMKPLMTDPDLLVLILSKLPFKDFCRLKRVCKSWNGLASDPFHSKLLPKPPTAEE